MRIIYRKQLPGEPPRETRFEGWMGALIGVIGALAFLVLLVILIPFLLIGVLAFVAFVLFMLVAGWVYLGFRIGFRNLWDITRLALGFGLGGSSWTDRVDRLKKEWENRTKGKPGVWTK